MKQIWFQMQVNVPMFVMAEVQLSLFWFSLHCISMQGFCRHQQIITNFTCRSHKFMEIKY